MDHSDLPADIAQLLGRLRDGLLAVADPARLHPYWYGDRMTRWQLKVMTRAELASAGVPAELAREIRRRRDGQAVTLGTGQRVRRARLARQIMRRGVSRLSNQ